MRVGSSESCEQQDTESEVSKVRDSGLFKCGQDARKDVGSRAVDTEASRRWEGTGLTRGEAAIPGGSQLDRTVRDHDSTGHLDEKTGLTQAL